MTTHQAQLFPLIIPFVDLEAQYQSIEREVNAAIEQALLQGDFILGAEVDAFEQAYARFVGVEQAVGVSNGLDALRLALMALDIGPGDEVILPANTYIATALAVSAVGARPVLVDCDASTYNIDVDAVASAITSRSRAVIPVHLTGQAADMEVIATIAERHGLAVIEDAAQAHGTRYRGRLCGALGTLGCFSFYPAKNLGAYGDGGIITTDDARLAERLRGLRHYGQLRKNEHSEKGLNARLDTLQAAILKVKLRHLIEWNAARVRHAETYRQCLQGVGDLRMQGQAPYSSHIYHLFVIETDDRDALQQHLSAAGIHTGIHYPTPIHLQPAYADLGYHKGDFPQTERLAHRILSLPMFPELRDEQIARVVETIAAFYASSSQPPSASRATTAASRYDGQ